MTSRDDLDLPARLAAAAPQPPALHDFLAGTEAKIRNVRRRRAVAAAAGVLAVLVVVPVTLLQAGGGSDRDPQAASAVATSMSQDSQGLATTFPCPSDTELERAITMKIPTDTDSIRLCGPVYEDGVAVDAEVADAVLDGREAARLTSLLTSAKRVGDAVACVGSLPIEGAPDDALLFLTFRSTGGELRTLSVSWPSDACPGSFLLAGQWHEGDPVRFFLAIVRER